MNLVLCLGFRDYVKSTKCFLALFVANLKFWLNSAHLKICIRQTIGYRTMLVFSDCLAKILFTYDLVYEGFLVKLWGYKLSNFFPVFFWVKN